MCMHLEQWIVPYVVTIHAATHAGIWPVKMGWTVSYRQMFCVTPAFLSLQWCGSHVPSKEGTTGRGEEDYVADEATSEEDLQS